MKTVFAQLIRPNELINTVVKEVTDHTKPLLSLTSAP